MELPTAPGRSFLKVTGIFYIVASGVSSIIALMVRFIYTARTIGEVVPYINSYLSVTAQEALPIWRFTALNNVFAILERVHCINPKIEPISAVASRVPQNPIYFWYALYLKFSAWSYSAGLVLTFVAVIIGIFLVFIGIMAVKYCEPSKRSKLLVIFAMINLVMMVVSTILLVSFFSVLGCGITVLYFVGASQNYISYEKFYTGTDRIVYIKKIIKYVGITVASILCMTILFLIVFQSKVVRLINDSKFYLNGNKDSSYIHIIDENHLQLIDFDVDNLTKPFEERLGFNGDDLEFIQKLYSGEIEFKVEDNRISLILPRYKGYDTGFSITYINDITILFREDKYIKQ